LVLWLQRSQTIADVTELSGVVGDVVGRLRYLVNRDPEDNFKLSASEISKLHYTEDYFRDKMTEVMDLVESLPLASRLRSNGSNADIFEAFTENIYKPFISEIAEEIEARIQVDPVTQAFGCLDVRKFPVSTQELTSFGLRDISVLIQHFGEAKEATNPSSKRNNRADPLIDKNTTLQEYLIFKEVAYEIYNKRKEEIHLKINTLTKTVRALLKIEKNKTKIKEINHEIASLESKVENMQLCEIMASLTDSQKLLFPNVVFLLEVAIICPISNATVERLFSYMKLVKTKLRNQMGDSTLDKLLRIKTEGPESLNDAQLETLVNNFKIYSEECAKSGKIRITL